MAVRLRRAPPRFRRRDQHRLWTFGVAAAALTVSLWYVTGQREHDEHRLRIERLSPDAMARMRVVRDPAPLGLTSLPPLAPPRPFLADHRVVSFYGNPLAEALGVLGEQSPQQTITRVRAQAAEYERLSRERTVVPALHLIYAVAQSYPGEDEAYLLRMDDALVEQYVRLTRDNGMLLFLDIQMGRSTVEEELARIAKFLTNEHVHVALDPEFAWGKDGMPGVDIGSMDAAQVNQAQRMLQRLAMEELLPTKILVVHQFLPGMLKNKAALKNYDRVELVIDADGFGPRDIKRGAWARVIVDDGVQLAAIKLFYRQDPDLMSPADVLGLQPRPAIIIYQ